MFYHFKKFLKQILIYGLGDTINKIIGILIVPLFTRYLTPADYGVAGVLTVTSTLIIGLADLGLSNGIARFFYEEKESKRSQLISSAQIAMVFITIIIALLALIFKEQISQGFFRTSQYGELVVLSFLTIPLTMFLTAPMMRLRLEEKARVYAFINVSKIITGVTLNIILIVFLHRGLLGLFEGQLINAAFYAFLIGIYTFKTNGLYFSKPLFKKMFAFSYPFIFGLGLFWILNWADRFILARLTNLTETGLYTLGYTMGMAIMLPVGAFHTAWTPFYMSVSKQRNIKQIYSLMFTYYSLIMGFLVLSIAVFSRDYFYFFTPQKFHSAYTVVPIISMAYALNGVFSIVAVGSFIKKKTLLQLIAEAGAVIINIVLMFVLIPYLGRMGAAWATLAAYLGLAVIMYLLVWKIFPIKYETRRIFQIIFISFSVYFLAKMVYEPEVSNLFLRLLIVMIYPLALFILGFFHKGEMTKIKNLFPIIFKGAKNVPPTNEN